MSKHFLFVYGTLRKHENNSQFLKEAKCVTEQAWTKGVLYDTGCGYPAMKASSSKYVYGEVYEVNEEQLREIDRLEDYKESRSSNLYDRIIQSVFTDSGECKAFLYIASDQLTKLRQEIPLGDWKEYLYYKGKQTY
ncbi:gamma-glutamylcyclotransferase [Alkalihalobacillus sp. BA299]|uniref:gamma-glutamylcyclotransferase family protein n=1 Tax=Alkalihalobacillus sp. BA299 TaxID=2815938 RepID=UPI001ADC3C5F|nr:gamma-glutamylcyclotransferase family protein [Alkalihalobacillus sp. BA299]